MPKSSAEWWGCCAIEVLILGILIPPLLPIGIALALIAVLKHLVEIKNRVP